MAVIYDILIFFFFLLIISVIITFTTTARNIFGFFDFEFDATMTAMSAVKFEKHIFRFMRLDDFMRFLLESRLVCAHFRMRFNFANGQMYHTYIHSRTLFGRNGKRYVSNRVYELFIAVRTAAGIVLNWFLLDFATQEQ